MPNLLVVLSSPRGDYSVSRNLTSTFVEAWKKNHSGGEVVTRDLFETELPFVDLPWIAGAYTPAEQHSPEMTEALKVSNTLIAELEHADHIVIGTSMYNFSTPAILKAYIDHIVRVNRTFTPSYEGLAQEQEGHGHPRLRRPLHPRRLRRRLQLRVRLPQAHPRLYRHD